MEIFFKEKQKFTQWWLWVILLIFPILSVMPFADYGDNGVNLYFVLIGVSIPLLFYLFELRTFVTKEGLHYQFFPFHFKTHLIKIEEIEKIEALQYKPLGDYGGWGIRYGFNGKAYNVSGDKGVKVHLPNERNILFGSKKHIEFHKALKKAMK